MLIVCSDNIEIQRCELHNVNNSKITCIVFDTLDFVQNNDFVPRFINIQ